MFLRFAALGLLGYATIAAIPPIVAAGTPEDIVKAAAPSGRSPQGEGRSYTGQFLKPVLARGGPRRKRRVEAAE